MAGSFAKKILEAALTLEGGFFSSGTNTLVLSGLRMSLEVEKGGQPSKNAAKLRIYGMTEQDMDSATTTAFKALGVRKNLLRVRAGDEGSLAVVFQGEITGAWAVYHEPPGLYFQVEALSGYYPAVVPVPPRSFSGGAAVAQIMETLAASMGYAFDNAGVDAVLSNPYLSGSDFQQAQALAEASGIDWGVDDGTLWIAPPGQPRAGEAPLVSPETGMIGYPTFDKEGLEVRALYNPAFKHGGVIKVESSIRPARGVWRVHGLKHHLESERPGGKWETTLKASYVGG